MATTNYDLGVLALSPASYWKLDEASGNYADSVGGQTLTARTSASYPVYGVPTGLAGVGNGVQFGVTQAGALTTYAIKTSAIAQIVSNKFSIVGWWNIIDLSTSNTPLVCASVSGGHVDPFYTFYLGTNAIVSQWRVAIATTGVFTPATIGGAMPIGGGWTHIAFTWDGTTATVYENAVVEGAPATIAGASVASMGSFAINNIPALDSFSYASGSSASRVAYWNNRCLSQADIAALYSLRNTSLGDTPTPVPPIFHGRGAA